MPTVSNWTKQKNHRLTTGLENRWIKRIGANPPPLRSGKRWNNNQATLTEEGGLGLLVTRTGAHYVVRVTFDGIKTTWRIPDGNRELMCLKEARRRAVEIRSGAERGIHVNHQSSDGQVTFESLVEPYLEELATKGAPEHVKARRNYLLAACEGRECGPHSFPGIGSLTLQEVTPRRVSAIARWYHVREKPGGERAMHFALKGLFQMAIGRGLLKEAQNPILGWRPPPAGRREGVLSKEEFQKVQHALERYSRDETKKLPWRLAALGILLKSLTGMRTTEVSRLRREEIRLAAGELLIKKHKTVKKTKAPRRIPLTDRAKDVIGKILALAPESPFLLPHPSSPMTQHIAVERSRVWMAVCKQAQVDTTGLGGVGVLRRSFLTLLIDHAGLMSTQRIAGHKKLATTERYLEQASFAKVLQSLKDMERRMAQNLSCGVCGRSVAESELCSHEFTFSLGISIEARVWYCKGSATCQHQAMKKVADLKPEEKAA